MSELEAYIAPTADGTGLAEYYLKSEADKMIADLENKLAVAQQTLRLNQPEALYSDLETMGRLSHEIMELKKACKDKDDWCLHTLKELRHQKYKRCLAMARWCNERIARIEKDYASNFYKRWKKRWLEFAEKIKEAK